MRNVSLPRYASGVRVATPAAAHVNLPAGCVWLCSSLVPTCFGGLYKTRYPKSRAGQGKAKASQMVAGFPKTNFSAVDASHACVKSTIASARRGGMLASEHQFLVDSKGISGL